MDLDKLLSGVEKPARYIGGEYNSIMKEDASLRWALCFPDVYEIGMSHLGSRILYHILNDLQEVACERAFAPWPDMGKALREAKLPLFTLETKRPLAQCDIIGFSLLYEMCYTNILTMLDLAGLPLRAKDRAEGMPLVVAGGPCVCNPMPVAPFFDALLLGDGEELIVEVSLALLDARRRGLGRQAQLREIAAIPGVYVPELRDESGAPAVRRIVKDLDAVPFTGRPVVPYLGIVHDRVALEVMRGCTRGCRFCQAGMLYRPVRERSPGKLLEQAQALFEATGYEEISLSSLSTGDYSQLLPLIRGLNERFEGRRVSLSLPSLRVDGPLQEVLADSGRVKKSGLTLAPEAGTQRLRDVINKGVTEEDLLRAVREAFEAGWNSVKLYFMIGLPTETDEDVLGVAALARKVVDCYYALPREKRARGLKVVVSASTFVPKPFTPFQWAAQDRLEEIRRKQGLLRNALNIRGVTFNWHDPETSFLEACFARGGRELSPVLLRAYELGCRLDGWSEHFNFQAWLQAFSDAGVDPAFIAHRAREKDERFPWDFVDIGVTRGYLWLENERALRGQTTPDCREGCGHCGLRRFEGVCPE